MADGAAAFIGDVRQWAEAQWGGVKLGDERLERRVVELGAQMAQLPDGSLPAQMKSRSRLKAAYRLLSHKHVSHQGLSQPHWEATRARMGAEEVVLLIQDVTELDFTHYAKTMTGLGQVGDGSGQGLHLHTTLALLPSNAQVLGLAHQQVFKRVALPAGRKWYHRPKAERSSRVWPEAVGAIGAPPPGVRWVLVADGGADANDLLAACRQQRIDFTIRLVYEHRLVSDDPEPAYALSTARGWPGMGHLTVEVPATAGQPARQAQLQLSFGAICLRMPRKLAPLPVWVVRTWEPQPPAGAEGLEWLLVTSCPVHSRDQALERLNWYLRRWVIEDYHQCLKTGCHIEHRDLEHADRIERLLGFLALIAVRLLQLRQDARLTPDAPAITLVEPLLVSLLVAELGLRRPTLTLRDFWRGVAHLGGFQGRRSDGDPGWKTLWRGWRYLDSLARGARLAAAAPLP